MSLLLEKPQVEARFWGHSPRLSQVGELGTIPRMQTVRSTKLTQSGWTTTLDRVRGGEALAILQRGKPVAALLPYSLWQRAAAGAPVPADKQQTNSSHQVRENLRIRREDASLRGKHTMITWHGSNEPEVVLAPYDWARDALPELGELIITED